MIETEISSSDTPTMEEFTPPRYKNRDKQLRILVQIVSFIAIALFFSKALRIPEYEKIFVLISDSLFIVLLVFFLMGLGVSFFQIRYINDRRNKITNLGGIIGLSGLLLTGIPCACELGLEQTLYEVVSSLLPFLLGFGLFLTAIGFFAEATSIDEMLIYIIRTNFYSIIRYSLTTIGAFLVNFGLLIVFIWPLDLAGGFVSSIGILIVWGAWFQHINRLLWNNRLLMFRAVELSISQALVVLVLIIPIYTSLMGQQLSIITFLMIVLLGFAGIIILYADLVLFGLPERLRDLNRRVIIIFQTIVLISAISLIGMGLLYSTAYFQVPSDQFMLNVFIGSFRVFYVGISLLLIYRMWFRALNKFMTKTLLILKTYYKEIITTGTLLPLIYGISSFPITEGDLLSDLIPSFAIVAGYFLGVVVWYKPKHPLSRRINTAFSSVIAFWSLFMVLYRISIIPGALFILYFGVDTFLWRKELYHILQQVLNAFKQLVLAIIEFVRVNFREFVTVFSLSSMFLGLVGTIRALELVSLGLFFLGYIACCAIWRFPSRHSNFRGIATSVSIFSFFWGVFLLSWYVKPESDLFEAPFLITFLLLGLGSFLPINLWRVELWQLTRQIVEALKQAFITTFKIVINFLKAVGKALIQSVLAVLEFVQTKYREFVTALSLSSMLLGLLVTIETLEFIFLFFFGYIACCAIWRFPSRHSNFRGITTSVSIFSFFWGIFLLLQHVKPESDLFEAPFLITFLLLGLGSFLPINLWRVELWQLAGQIVEAIKQIFIAIFKTVVDFLKAVLNASIQLALAIIEFVRVNYREFVTVFSLSSMFLGLVGTITETHDFVFLFFLGYIVCCSVWRFPNRHSNFRGITTSVSIFSFFWGVLLLLWYVKPESDLFEAPFLITFLLLGLGSFLPINLWRVELWQLAGQIGQALKQALMTTIKIVTDFLKAAWNAFKQTFWAIVHSVHRVLIYIHRSLVSLVQYVREKFWLLIRYSLSMIGVLMISGGLILLGTQGNIGLLLIFGGFLIICGAWWENTLLILRATAGYLREVLTSFVNYTIQAAKFLRVKFLALLEFGRKYLEEIVKTITTIVGIILVLLGLFPDYEFSIGPLTTTDLPSELFLIVGAIILYATWFLQVNNILIATARSIRNALGAFGHYIWDIGVEIKDAVVKFLRYVLSLWKEILRASTTIIGAFLILIGIYPLNLVLVALGIGILYASWFSQVNEFLMRTARSIRDALGAVGHYLWDIGVEIKDTAGKFFRYVLSLWKEILRASTTIIGSFLIYAGILQADIVFIFVGLVILYVTWLSQVNEFLMRTARSIRDAIIAFGHYIWDIGVEIKDMVVSFFTYVISLWREIVRAAATIVGAFLVIIGFYDLYGPSNSDPTINVGLIILGIVMITLSWRSQIKELLIRTARSIRDALGVFGHYIWDVGVEIKDAIVRFLTYVLNLWREIIRASATIIGAFLVFFGLYNFLFDSEKLKVVNLGLIALGFILISVSWRSQIIELIVKYGKALVNMLGKLAKTIGEIATRIWTQLSQIIRNAIDSSFYIAIVTLGVVALGYGLILFISVFTNDQGAWTEELFGGTILWLLASFLQGKPTSEVTDLIGIFANDEPYILFFLGIIFVVFGIALPVIFFFLRESIKISSLRQRSQGSKIKEALNDE